MSMRLNSQTLLALACPLLLAACGNSDSDTTADDVVEAAQYQGVYLTSDGRPQLATVAISDSGESTLSILDDEDYVSVAAGSIDGNAISFGTTGECAIGPDNLNCDFINTQSGDAVSLSPVTDEFAPELSALAGKYNLLVDGTIMTLSIAGDGTFSGTLMSCEANGQIEAAPGGQLLTIQVESGLCGDSRQFGFIETNNLYETNDALAVYLPDSELSGYWIR